MSVNKVILVGNLGRDAELKFTAGGQPVSSFSLATTEKYTSKDGEKKETTEWHRIVLWGKTAEVLQEYLVKGKQIYVEGKLSTREWQDKDGNKRKSTEVNAQRVVLLGGGRGNGAGRSREQHEEPGEVARGAQAANAPGEDDIPF